MVGSHDDVFDFVGTTVAPQRKGQVGTNRKEGNLVAVLASFFVKALGLQVTHAGIDRRHYTYQHRLARIGGAIDILEVRTKHHKGRSLVTYFKFRTDERLGADEIKCVCTLHADTPLVYDD